MEELHTQQAWPRRLMSILSTSGAEGRGRGVSAGQQRQQQQRQHSRNWPDVIGCCPCQHVAATCQVLSRALHACPRCHSPTMASHTLPGITALSACHMPHTTCAQGPRCAPLLGTTRLKAPSLTGHRQQGTARAPPSSWPASSCHLQPGAAGAGATRDMVPRVVRACLHAPPASQMVFSRTAELLGRPSTLAAARHHHPRSSPGRPDLVLWHARLLLLRLILGAGPAQPLALGYVLHAVAVLVHSHIAPAGKQGRLVGARQADSTVAQYRHLGCRWGCCQAPLHAE